jgi:ketosteroid isomerase-like protein
MTESFEDFLRRREQASNDYIRGDAAALAAMLTEHDPATFMPPTGAVFEHADQVSKTQIEGAQAFGPDGEGHFEILNSGSSGTVGFWTGRQHANVTLAGRDTPIDMVLRTTEVFRLEDGQWKLVHRHADTTPAPEG